MKKITLILLSFFFAFQISAHHNDGKRKEAILLVHFGTTVPSAKVALDNIEEEVRKAFPEMEIRWAYTAKMIRKKLEKQGIHTDSPTEALAKLGEDGYTHIAVQSLHTIPGSEYHDLLRIVNSFQLMPKGTHSVTLGAPLMSKHSDVQATVDALIQNIPSERKAKEAVVLMGHGTHHEGNIYYPGLQYYLWQKDPNVFVGSVEGFPVLDDVIVGLKKNKVKTVWLIPFMSVAGVHTEEDMIGEGSDSWKNILESKGYKVKSVIKGTAEYDNIVNIWVDHLKGAYKELQKL